MAKKQKRSTSQSVKYSSTGSTTAAATARTDKSSSASFEFNPDYSYIVKDLKRIGILAGSFIAIIVILSFFL